MKFDPLDRIIMAQIMQHSWLKMKKQSFQDLEGQFHFIFQSIQDENPVPIVLAGQSNDVHTECGDNISPMKTERERGSKRISVITEGFSPKGMSSDTFFKSSSPSNKTKSPRRTSLSALDDFTDELDKSISDHFLEPTFSASNSNSPSPVPYRQNIDTDVLHNTYSGEHSSYFGDILSNGGNLPCEFSSSPRFEVKGWGASRSRDNNDNTSPIYEKTRQQKTISRNRSSDALILANLEKFDDGERTYLRTRAGTEDRSKCSGRFTSSSSSFTSRQSLSQGTTVNSSCTTSSHTTNNNSLRSVQSSQSNLADEIDKRLHDLEKLKETVPEKGLCAPDSPHISPKRS